MKQTKAAALFFSEKCQLKQKVDLFLDKPTHCKGHSAYIQMDTPRYVQWTIPSLWYQTRRKNPLVYKELVYEGCSNMNASGFITFFTYMLRQNGKRFYKGLYVTFKLAPDLKTNTVYLSSYSPWNKGHVSILTHLML